MRSKIHTFQTWIHDHPFVVDVLFGVILVICVRLLFSKDECLTLMSHASWQIVFLCVIILFRTPITRVLEELPSFLRRSYYRQGNDIRSPLFDAIPIGGDNEGESDGEVENGDKLKLPEKDTDSSAVERWVLEMLRNEYGVEIRENMSIGVSHYYFDGVMEFGGRIYGIEIQGLADFAPWEVIFTNVQKAFDGFTDEQKRRFTLLVCVGGKIASESKRILRSMGNHQKYTVIFKFYEKS